MLKIETFEAAGCCATSSVVVSDGVIRQSTSAGWAKEDGVNIQRYSLVRNLQQLLNTPVIKEFLNTSGIESLPVTLLDDKLMMAGKLPTRGDVARWAGIPLTQDQNEDNAQPHCCSIPRMP